MSADSRTLKAASSFVRFGWRSIVFEGEQSPAIGPGLSFEVRSGLPRGRHRDQPGGVARLLSRARRLMVSVERYLVAPLRAIPAADVYHLHSYSLFPAVYLRSRMHRAPVVYDAHDHYPSLYGATGVGQGPWPTWLHRRLERACVHHAVAVLTVSEGVADLYEAEFGVRPTVVRNVHDRRLDAPGGRSLREHLGVGRSDFLLVTVGQCKPGMAVAEVLEALAVLPEGISLALVGGGYEEAHGRTVDALGLRNRVHLAGRVAPTELVPFIASADAALVLYVAANANLRNCLPNGFFQAIAAGLPVLYPPLPEIARVAERYGLGVPIVPDDPASLTTVVAALADDPGRRAELARSARRAAGELAWEREETVLRGVVEPLITRRRAAARTPNRPAMAVAPPDGPPSSP